MASAAMKQHRIKAPVRSTLDREALYWHFPGYIDSRARPASLINKRVGERRYKLWHRYETGEYSLFDLTDDPGEKNNLLAAYATPHSWQIARQLSADLRRWLVNTGAERGHVRATGEPVPLPRLAAAPSRTAPQRSAPR